MEGGFVSKPIKFFRLIFFKFCKKGIFREWEIPREWVIFPGNITGMGMRFLKPKLSYSRERAFPGDWEWDLMGMGIPVLRTSLAEIYDEENAGKTPYSYIEPWTWTLKISSRLSIKKSKNFFGSNRPRVFFSPRPTGWW